MSYSAEFGEGGIFSLALFPPWIVFYPWSHLQNVLVMLGVLILVKGKRGMADTHSEGINISHLFIYLTNNCKGWPFTHLLGSVSTSPGFQEICCSSTNPERALGQFLRSRGADVGANELVMRHILGSLAAPSSATVSSRCAIRNKVCDTALS